MGVVEDYPASWYAATRKIHTNYPILDEPVSADVCVVGAGFSGLATAIYLAEQGIDVVVVEANRVGWGASGRNGGQIVRGYGEDTPALVARTLGEKLGGKLGDDAGERARQLGYTCLDLLGDMIAKYQIDCDPVKGYVRLAMTRRQADHLRATAGELERHKAPGEVRFLEQADLGAIVGSDAYHAGLYTGSEGHLHPLNLALGEAQALDGLGGRIYEQSAATHIQYDQTGGPVRITTQNGTESADTLVLCGNAYLEKLEPRLCPTLVPGYSGIIATEPMAADIVKRIMPHPVACSDMRTVMDYYRLTPDGRLLWGGLAHWTGDDSEDPTALLRKRMVKIFPELAGVGIDYTWTGRIGISANLNPQIGRLAPNVYYAQAYSGHGVASTHLSGRMICDAITGRAEGAKDFDMFASLNHLAIPANPLIRKLARAWVMNSRRVMEWF